MLPTTDVQAEALLLHQPSGNAPHYNQFAIHTYKILRAIRSLTIADAYAAAIYEANSIFGESTPEQAATVQAVKSETVRTETATDEVRLDSSDALTLLNSYTRDAWVLLLARGLRNEDAAIGRRLPHPNSLAKRSVDYAESVTRELLARVARQT